MFSWGNLRDQCFLAGTRQRTGLPAKLYHTSSLPGEARGKVRLGYVKSMREEEKMAMFYLSKETVQRRMWSLNISGRRKVKIFKTNERKASNYW